MAVLYGADAVYIGGEMYGLRAKAHNFSKEDMIEGIAYAHAHGVKVYVTANITVPTTVAELSDASTYVTQNSLATQLANKQNTLTAGDHINITGSTIKAVDYVHSDDPVSTTAVTPVVTNNMIADGTITADKLATGATVKLTLSTSDIGEGAALAANTLYGVYI